MTADSIDPLDDFGSVAGRDVVFVPSFDVVDTLPVAEGTTTGLFNKRNRFVGTSSADARPANHTGDAANNAAAKRDRLRRLSCCRFRKSIGVVPVRIVELHHSDNAPHHEKRTLRTSRIGHLSPKNPVRLRLLPRWKDRESASASGGQPGTR